MSSGSVCRSAQQSLRASGEDRCGSGPSPGRGDEKFGAMRSNGPPSDINNLPFLPVHLAREPSFRGVSLR